MSEATTARLDLSAATAVVTGAGGGIGAGIARAFARRGTQIVVSDIEQEAADRVAAEIRAEGGKALALQADVTSLESMERLRDAAYEQFGSVQVLCNNAGVTLRPFRAIWEASAADFEWTMRVNYLGVVNGLLAFLPRMRAQGSRAHIVNTSSMVSLVSLPGHGPYAASKAAVDALSDLLREELADHGDDIGVTVVHPSNVPSRIATSDRLRVSEDPAALRSVVPYPYRRVRPVKNDPLDPAMVGEMVVAAVLADLPYCLTHEADLSEVRARTDSQEGSYATVRALAGEGA